MLLGELLCIDNIYGKWDSACLLYKPNFCQVLEKEKAHQQFKDQIDSGRIGNSLFDPEKEAKRIMVEHSTSVDGKMLALNFYLRIKLTLEKYNYECNSSFDSEKEAKRVVIGQMSWW